MNAVKIGSKQRQVNRKRNFRILWQWFCPKFWANCLYTHRDSHTNLAASRRIKREKASLRTNVLLCLTSLILNTTHFITNGFYFLCASSIIVSPTTEKWGKNIKDYTDWALNDSWALFVFRNFNRVNLSQKKDHNFVTCWLIDSRASWTSGSVGSSINSLCTRTVMVGSSRSVSWYSLSNALHSVAMITPGIIRSW